MICPTCGKEIPNNQKFCNFCGAKIEAPAAQPVTATVTTAAKKETDFSKISFILAIIGSALTYFSIPFVSLFAGTPLGVVALCMSSIELYKAKQDGRRADSKVIAAFVLGLVVALFFILGAASTDTTAGDAIKTFGNLLGSVSR